MTAKLRYIPDDLAEYTLQLYRDFGIDVITRRDKKGNSLELNIPYDLGEGQMCGYEISRDGANVKVRFLGKKSYPCSMTKEDKQELLDLFRKIDKFEIRPNEPRKGPHRLRICT